MISTDFAPNEEWDDAGLSFKLLFQPWRWKKGEETENVKKQVLQLFDDRANVALFLTGRAALYFLLKSLNLPAGSGVLVQGFTCEAVVLPVIQAGFKPVYVDIESDSFSMSYDDLVSKSADELTGNCHVLILQHTFGLTPRYRNEILDFAKKNNLIVIEDLAHGFDPNLFKSDSGSLKPDNYYLLSFGRSKALSSVFGGAIVTGNKQPANKLTYPSCLFIFRLLLYKPLSMLIKSTYDVFIGKMIHFVAERLGVMVPEISKTEKNSQYDKMYEKAYPNALSILLSQQLKKYDRIMSIRRKTCKEYERMLDQKDMKFPKTNLPLIRFPVLTKKRDEIIRTAAKKNIFLGKWYDHVVAPKEIDLSKVGYEKGSCPEAERITKLILNLPTYRLTLP